MASTEDQELLAEILMDRVAIWILGYAMTVGWLTREKIDEDVEFKDVNVHDSLEKLKKANLLRELDNKQLVATEGARAIFKRIGIEKLESFSHAKYEISCDVLKVNNVDIASASEAAKNKLVESLQSERLHGTEGAKYGFVDVGLIRGHVVYGNFTQQYFAHYLNYDDQKRRVDAWEPRYYNVTFVWPLNSQVFVLQDSKFHGAGSLDMKSTTSRIQMLLQLLLSAEHFKRDGDCYFTEYLRHTSRQEMMHRFLDSKEQITEAIISLNGDSQPISEPLLVFNPKFEWNSILTDIIKESEIPNVAGATFRSTKNGNLRDSAFVKAFTLIGRVKRMKEGRGKSVKLINELTPTHIGRVLVSDPLTKEDVFNILGFIQKRLELSLGLDYLPATEASKQMRLEMHD